MREMQSLADLDFSNRRPSADLREEVERIVRSSHLRTWLRHSDDLVDRLKGSQRLRKRRRRGILRNTSMPDLGLPFFRPPIELYRTSDSPSPLVVALLDELEWIVVAGRTDQGQFMPLKSEITFDEARGIVGMRASVLYELTSRRLVPGQIIRQRGDDPDSNIRELRFASREFMLWASYVARASTTPK
jgi:hypothetical protein